MNKTLFLVAIMEIKGNLHSFSDTYYDIEKFVSGFAHKSPKSTSSAEVRLLFFFSSLSMHVQNSIGLWWVRDDVHTAVLRSRTGRCPSQYHVLVFLSPRKHAYNVLSENKLTSFPWKLSLYNLPLLQLSIWKEVNSTYVFNRRDT